MEIIKLNRTNLKKFKTPVKIPKYEQSKLNESIVHLGFGNFHRAHQVVYLDKLLNTGVSDAGIFEMNIVPDPFPIGEIMAAQDNLFTLVTKNPKGEADVEIVGAIKGYFNASTDKEPCIARLADEHTTLVTLTVTENGYYYNKKTGEPEWNDPAVAHDLKNPSDPKTAAGFIAAALARRYKSGRKPLTIMSCDNVPANGEVLKTGVMSFCSELYPEIVPWVENEVGFPS